jgi:hypothetical protein
MLKTFKQRDYGHTFQIADIGMNGMQIAAESCCTTVGIGAVGAALVAFSAMGAASQVTGAIGDAVSGVIGWFTGIRRLHLLLRCFLCLLDSQRWLPR